MSGRFLVRAVESGDESALLSLAKTVHSVSLPVDAARMDERIALSCSSFAAEIPSEDRRYVFVLVDLEKGHTIGTSTIVARQGTPERPHFFFKVSRREHYSSVLQSGHVHVTLQLGENLDGPTELAGLVIESGYRRHPQRLGMLTSLTRFNFIATHRDAFRDRLLAQVMGNVTPDGRNLLWDYLGRRFVNLSYLEADEFCRRSNLFIRELFPDGEIYASILPPEARNLIGTVGPDAGGAYKLLTSLGFTETGEIDPFDGGPYLEAVIDDVELIAETKSVDIVGVTEKGGSSSIISTTLGGTFRATSALCQWGEGGLLVAPVALDVLGISVGDRVVTTPGDRR
jgi:arginine N-succinyltransferase